MSRLKSMNTYYINEILLCPVCHQQLESPIVLPCATVCEKHLTLATDFCLNCGGLHEADKRRRDLGIEALLKLKRSECHTQAVEAVVQFEQHIERLKQLHVDPAVYIDECVKSVQFRIDET